jgi:beta-phosphoglucomutase
MKKGFIFDLDGVIADTAKFHYIAWKALASQLGIEIDEVFNEQLKGISRLDSLERILEHGNKTGQFSVAEKEAFAERKNTHYVELLQNLSPADILPGVKTFLEKAHKLGIPCAIASASKNAPFILEKLQLIDYFIVIIDPATLTKGKPDPEIFLKACEALNIEPQDAVGFEDAQAGIAGIKKAGMLAVGVESNESLAAADICVQQLDTLDINSL